MRLELICTGGELIDGRLADTNTQLLARILQKAGLMFEQVTLVGDRIQDIEQALRQALERSEVVIVSGGLGPTIDDITRDAAATVFDAPLVEDQEVVAFLEKLFSRFGRQMTENNRRQAQFPRGAKVLPNPMGTAAGFVCEKEEKSAVFLPGVPRELELMAQQHVVPYLTSKAGAGHSVASVTLKTFGQTESGLDKLLRNVDLGGVELAYAATFPEIHLTLISETPTQTEAAEQLDRARRLIEQEVGEFVFTDDERTMEEIVADMLGKRKLTLATAESCTGGMIAARLTNVPGSSAWFSESMVTYSNEAKTKRLGVDENLLQEHGAVSEQAAVAMAEGMRREAGTDLALAVTGIAGPSGGSKEKPVGTVYMALAGPAGTRIWHNHFPGDRNRVRVLTAQTGLNRIRRLLMSWKP